MMGKCGAKKCGGDDKVVALPVSEVEDCGDLPALLSIGMESMGVNTTDSYSADDLLQSARRAFKRFPSHKLEIALTTLWLTYENSCTCDIQKNNLREAMAFVVESLEA